jgi:hypothetical protein
MRPLTPPRKATTTGLGAQEPRNAAARRKPKALRGMENTFISKSIV